MGPHPVASMLGVAIRIAQRIGIHNELANARCTAFEAEMRRRLWWSLVNFDYRICEMSDLKTTILDPTWDCRTPLNVNDSDIRPEMKCLPVAHERPTEVIFAVVRSKLNDFIRHSASHLNFNNPSLWNIAKVTQRGLDLRRGEVIALEKTLEDVYLKHCNNENPLHFMTIWLNRGVLAKMRLMEYYHQHSKPSLPPTDAQRDAATAHAINMLDCDTKVIASSLTKGYQWLAEYYFPFPAYIHILTDLKKRPTQANAETCWQAVDKNYEARDIDSEVRGGLFQKIFARIMLQVWAAHEAVFRKQGKSLQAPRVVTILQSKTIKPTSAAGDMAVGQLADTPDMAMDDFSMFMPMNFDWQGSTDMDFGEMPDTAEQTSTTCDVNSLDWTPTDWNSIYTRD